MKRKAAGIILIVVLLSGLAFTVDASESDVESQPETECMQEAETEPETECMQEAETELETECVSEAVAELEIECVSEAGTGPETECASEAETGRADEGTSKEKTSLEKEYVPEAETGAENDTDTVFSVAFPANSHFKFTLDPYGLKTLKEGEAVSVNELSSRAGNIYCDSELMVTNKSSVPVKLKVDIQMTGDVNVVETMEEVEENNENNVFMYIIPSENDLKGGLESYEQSDTGIVMKGSGPTLIEFILPPGSGCYQKSVGEDDTVFMVNDAERGHSTAFRIAGKVNRRADWSAFDDEGKSIGMQIKYSYESAADMPVVCQADNSPFGLVSHNSTAVELSAMEKY